MESLCLFTCQEALKLGYLYWLRVKNWNPLLTELSLCYLKHKILFIISFNLFLIAWLWGYCTFSDSSVVTLKSSP